MKRQLQATILKGHVELSTRLENIFLEFSI